MPIISAILSLSGPVMLGIIFFSHSETTVSNKVSSFMTPPSRVLNGLPSAPFIVPKGINSNLVSSETILAFLAARKTCSKCKV